MFFGNVSLFCECKLFEHLATEVTSPLNLESGDLLPLAGVFSLGLFCFALDKTVNENLAEARRANLDFFKNADIMGDGYFTLGASAALYLVGGEKERKTALNVVESFIETGLVTGIIKTGFGRRRPDSGFDAFTFEPFGLRDDSFPSGHTAVAFSTAAVLAKAYDIGIITYPLASFVGLSRMYKEKHWLSDVFFGAVIGTLIGNIHDDSAKNDMKTYFKYNGTEMSFIIKNKF